MSDELLPSVLSVRELTAYIKRLFERDEVLQDIIVRGEVSNVKRHRSGHLYFTLKDEDAALDCVCFRGVVGRLSLQVENGMQVVAGGHVSVYEKQGRYQLIVLFLRPDGVGALHAAFERLRAKLEAEGLFRPERKRPLPRFPRGIALVTSPTGAAVHDLTTILARRFPLARVVIVPTVVQGEAAPASLIRSLHLAGDLPDVDVIIVGRGGGSLEDLWAFNDEGVARAIFASPKPVVSAVGHETDVTIADLVADVRAPTPSAAAELAVPDSAELLQYILGLGRRALSASHRNLQRFQSALVRLTARTPLRRPASILEQWFLRADDAGDRASRAASRILEGCSLRLRLASTRLEAQRPAQVLRRRRERLATTEMRLQFGLLRLLNRARQRLSLAAAELRANHPRRALAARAQLVKELTSRARAATQHRRDLCQWRLNRLAGQLDALNPRAVLERGYSLTFRLPTETVVRSAGQVQPDDELRILLARGELRALTTQTSGEEPAELSPEAPPEPSAKDPPARESRPDDADQAQRCPSRPGQRLAVDEILPLQGQ